MEHSYPNLRDYAPPPFIADKYKDIVGLLKALLAHGKAEGLPLFLVEEMAQTFPTIEAAFHATRGELAAALYQVLPEMAAPEPEAGGATLPDPRAVAAGRYSTLLQRLMLWAEPSEVFAVAKKLLGKVMVKMPRTLAEVEGAGGRDPLDPFIVAFAELLLKTDSPRRLLEIVVVHKCLMKLEDAIGHLHEEVLGRAGGHVRVPEPKGVRIGATLNEKGKLVGGQLNKEVWHETLNPYPGADARADTDEFYQIKNKTGSAKGSDGEKLGRQFRQLAERYPYSRRFYMSMIGQTLTGHRSMGAFLRTDPDAEILVGLSSFQQIGRHRETPAIAMELYLEAFRAALIANAYDFEEIVNAIAEEWKNKHGMREDTALGMLRDTVSPRADDPEALLQSSRTYFDATGVRPEAVGEAPTEEDTES